MGDDDKHLSLRLSQHGNLIRAVGFNKGQWADELSDQNQLYDFAFQPVINEYFGKRSVEMRLIDYRKSRETA